MHIHSASLKRGPMGLGLLMIAAACLLGAACPPTVRLQATYDSEPVNTVPQTQPAPSPPHDFFNWGAIDVTARVHWKPGGGNMVEVKPTAASLGKGKYRYFTGYAWSDYLASAGAPQLRGGVWVSMQGSGRMVIAIRIVHPNVHTPIGGYLVSASDRSVGYMSTQDLQVMDKNDAVLHATFLTAYQATFWVNLRWSIDQATRTINLAAYPNGGTANTASVQYQATGPGGTNNTPIPKIMMETLIFEAQQNTIVYFDDFLVEELGR